MIIDKIINIQDFENIIYSIVVWRKCRREHDIANPFIYKCYFHRCAATVGDFYEVVSTLVNGIAALMRAILPQIRIEVTGCKCNKITGTEDRISMRIAVNVVQYMQDNCMNRIATRCTGIGIGVYSRLAKPFIARPETYSRIRY